MMKFFFSENMNMKYPFFYRHLKAVEEDGWELFNPEIEFSILFSLSQQWRISLANSNFQVSLSEESAVLLIWELPSLGFECDFMLRLGEKWSRKRFSHI